MTTVHISPFSGQWYPDHPSELRSLLEELFERSRQRTGPYLLPRPAGFVVPHAGLIYSGAVAAAAYRHLRENPPARIVLLGFSHRGGPHGIAIPDVSGFETPLGRVPTDRAAMEQLRSCSMFRFVTESRVCDHSVEIQLPLLQHAAPEVPVVPLYAGEMSGESRETAARALAAIAGEGTVFLVSSDFTHYGPDFGYRPFATDKWTAERLEALDTSVIEAAGSLDPDLFLEQLGETGATVCGYSPIALWLSTARLRDELIQETLDYQTSGEILDDYHHSVSYAALGYFPAASFDLSARDRDLLLESAHRTLSQLRETGERIAVPPERIPLTLTRKAAVFVSLHQGSRLLGCVGTHTKRQPLAEAVPEMTLAAALDDPRFEAPVWKARGEIQIEISVLSPMKAIRDPAAVVPGKHGVYLRKGGHAALLLPQVAEDRSWTWEQFLEALAFKAGLGAHAYLAPDARLAVFQAQVFSTAQPANL